jgi:hypothetical protein
MPKGLKGSARLAHDDLHDGPRTSWRMARDRLSFGEAEHYGSLEFGGFPVSGCGTYSCNREQPT